MHAARFFSLLLVFLPSCGGPAAGASEPGAGFPHSGRFVSRDLALRGAEGPHSASHTRVLQDVDLEIRSDGSVHALVVHRAEVSSVGCPDLPPGESTVQACAEDGPSSQHSTRQHELRGSARMLRGAIAIELTHHDPVSMHCTEQSGVLSCGFESVYSWPGCAHDLVCPESLRFERE